MQGIGNHAGRQWRASALICALLLGACSTYQPLGHGSAAPWARGDGALRLAGGGGPVSDSGRAHRVRAGEGLARIARLHGVSMTELAALNRIAPPYTIYVDQVLRIPGEAVLTAVPVERPPLEMAAMAPAAGRVEGGYVVQRGDALIALAHRFDVPMPTLARINGIEPPYRLYPGQELRIPGGRAGLAGRPDDAGSIEVAQLAPAAGPVEEGYVVQRGDALIALARRFDVPMRTLARTNGIEPPYRLYPGQELRVPPGRAEPARREVARASSGGALTLSGEGFLWPVQGKVVGRFGPDGKGRRRDGIDIAARKGAPVRAAEGGVVLYADEAIRGYGRMILLRHADGYFTTYAHNAALLVREGERVERGQVIARVGDTGDVGEPRLHFEIRKGTKPVDPEALLVSEPTEVASSE